MKEQSQKQRSYNPQKDVIFGKPTQHDPNTLGRANFYNLMLKIYNKFLTEGLYPQVESKTTESMAQTALNIFNKKDIIFFNENPETNNLEEHTPDKTKKVLTNLFDALYEKSKKKSASENQTNGKVQKREAHSQDDRPNKRYKDSDNSHLQEAKPYAPSTNMYDPNRDVVLGDYSQRSSIKDLNGEQTFRKTLYRFIINNKSKPLNDELLEQCLQSFKDQGMHIFYESKQSGQLVEMNDRMAKKQLKVINETGRERIDNIKKQNVSYVPSNDPSINKAIEGWAQSFLQQPTAPLNPTQQYEQPLPAFEDYTFDEFNNLLTETNQTQYPEQQLNLGLINDTHSEPSATRNNGENGKQNDNWASNDLKQSPLEKKQRERY